MELQPTNGEATNSIYPWQEEIVDNQGIMIKGITSTADLKRAKQIIRVHFRKEMLIFFLFATGSIIFTALFIIIAIPFAVGSGPDKNLSWPTFLTIIGSALFMIFLYFWISEILYKHQASKTINSAFFSCWDIEDHPFFVSKTHHLTTKRIRGPATMLNRDIKKVQYLPDQHAVEIMTSIRVLNTTNNVLSRKDETREQYALVKLPQSLRVDEIKVLVEELEKCIEKPEPFTFKFRWR